MSTGLHILAIAVAVLVPILHVAHLTGLRNVLATAVLIGAVILMARQRSWPPLAGLWLAWVGVGVLSVGWSMSPETTLKSVAYEILMPAGAFYGAYLASRHRPGFMAICGGVAAGTVFLAGITALAYLSGNPWEVRTHDPSGVGYLYPGPGVASTLMVYTLPLGLLLGLNGNSRGRTLGWVLLLSIPAIGLGNQNRMQWLSFVGALAAFGVWQWARFSAMQRRATVLGVAVAFAAATFTVSTLTETRATYEISEDVRFDIWREWGAIWWKSPAFGYGLGKKVLSENLASELPGALIAREHNAASHAHNLFLNMALQVGLTGVAVFVLLLGGLARQAYRARKRERLATSAALAALIVGMLVKNATDDIMDHAVIVAFWLYAGMLVGRLAQETI